MPIVTGVVRMLGLFLLGVAAAANTAHAQELQNDAAAALLAAAAGQQKGATTAGAELPLHMTPAAADYDVEGGVGGEDPLASLRGVLDGLNEEDKADISGLDAENGLIRAVLSGAMNKDFFGGGMRGLLGNIRPQEAESVFELFPPVQKMPAWQSFLAAGESGDAEAAAGAKVSAVQELGKAMAALGALGSSPEGIMDAVRGFTESAEGEAADPELQALISQLEAGEGGGATIEQIQEKFLQRTLGADSTLTLADFTDTTWLETARASLLGNSDLVRLIGDSKVLSLLANADMAPRLPSDMPDPETLLESW